MWNQFVEFVNSKNPDQPFASSDSGAVEEFFSSIGIEDLTFYEMQNRLGNDDMYWISEIENHYNSIHDTLWIDEKTLIRFENDSVWTNYGDVQNALKFKSFYEYVEWNEHTARIDDDEDEDIYEYDEETENELIFFGSYEY